MRPLDHRVQKDRFFLLSLFTLGDVTKPAGEGDFTERAWLWTGRALPAICEQSIPIAPAIERGTSCTDQSDRTGSMVRIWSGSYNDSVGTRRMLLCRALTRIFLTCSEAD
eukprot:3913324-Prymnesium_polylepis.2